MGAHIKSDQTEILRSFFKTNQYPTKSQKEELANETGLSLHTVSNWFVTQRVKHRISRDKTVIECGQCAFQSTRKDHIAEHGEKTVGCKLCDYKSYGRSAVWAHTKFMHMERDLKCDLCDYKTALRGTLKEHIRTVHKRLNYSCSACDWSSKRKSNLNKHIRNEHIGHRIKCNECDWSTTRSNSLKTHMEDKHLGIRHFCDQCNFVATTKKGLEKHVNNMHQVSFCNVCECRSSSKPEFIKHQILHKLQCKQCDYVASRLDNMKIHVQAIHDQLTYPCKVCPYKSSTPRYLSMHVKSKHHAQEYTWNSCLDNKKEEIMMPRQPDEKIWARISFESFIRDYKIIYMWVTHSISLNQGGRKVEQIRKLNKLATTIETTPTQRQTNKLSFRLPLFLPPGVDPLHFRLFSNAHCCTYIPPF